MDPVRAPGPGSAYAAELCYFPGAEDLVLAAGIADERFDPEILGAAARSAAAAWATAVSSTSPAGRTDPPGRTELDGAADCGSGPAPRPLVAASLLHPGGAGACTRLVVREPRISRIQVAGLAAGAVPPFIALVTDVRGRRCIEDAGTGEPVSGRPDQVTWFYEFWQLVRDGPAARPRRLARPRSSPASPGPAASVTGGQT